MVVPRISGATWKGSSRKIALVSPKRNAWKIIWLGNKAVIQLSLRYKSNDHLWFTFFHEAGHIIRHGRKEIFIEGKGMDREKEEEANAFARDKLIPAAEYRRFKKSWDGRSLAAIETFAAKIKIAPGVVVGRLQHERSLPHSHGNGLKVFFSLHIPQSAFETFLLTRRGS